MDATAPYATSGGCGVALDEQSGTFYVATGGNLPGDLEGEPVLTKVSLATGKATYLPLQLDALPVSSLQLDGEGNAYLTSYRDLVKVSVTTGQVLKRFSLPRAPRSMALDGEGHAYAVFGELSKGTLSRISLTSGEVTSVDLGLRYLNSVAVDRKGDLYLADSGTGKLWKVPASPEPTSDPTPAPGDGGDPDPVPTPGPSDGGAPSPHPGSTAGSAGVGSEATDDNDSGAGGASGAATSGAASATGTKAEGNLAATGSGSATPIAVVAGGLLAAGAAAMSLVVHGRRRRAR
ncbi:hypothetical protein [Streptomyces sp. N35]|uniref:hypothetical protein n=1 Tax=Streptomyces sp. N35 TaxID=2795730 RepID=UPI0018F79B6F|nr:hypothetical protein [Streptomyces sp. N35]